MKYFYQWEKLYGVRRALLVPNPNQIPEIISDSFHECDLCLKNLEESDLDACAVEWIKTIREAMDISMITDGGHSLYLRKAKEMSADEIRSFALAVDELCDYFYRKNHES